MKITRTSNAGVLVELDGMSILLDGVCEGLYPYLPTPDSLKTMLVEHLPDVVAFTHTHKDHYDDNYVKFYKNEKLRSFFGPELSLIESVSNEITLQVIPTRHIGKFNIQHASFVIRGSKTILFTGDASPLVWKNIELENSPDILIVPYAYALSAPAFRITKSFEAKKIILVHMPDKNDDPQKLWPTVSEMVGDDSSFIFLEIGESIDI